MDHSTENITLPKEPSPEADQARLARKRRRKTTSNGAGEDCFACQKRGTTCDRRRPYCSPCLEVGKECSGYRTVLTWGIGVASRGKLRGMSLPIAIPGGKAVGPAAESARRRTSSLHTPVGSTASSKPTITQARINRKRSSSIKSEYPEQGYTFSQHPTTTAIQEEPVAPPPQSQWQLPPLRNIVFNEGQPFEHHFPSFMPPTIHTPDHTLSRHNSYEHSPLSSSASSILSGTSMSSYSDASFDRPYGNGPSNLDLPYPDPYPNVFSNHPFHNIPDSKTSPSEHYEYNAAALPERDDFMDAQLDSRGDNSPTPTPFGPLDVDPNMVQAEQNWSAPPVHAAEQVDSTSLDYADIKPELADEIDLLNITADLDSATTAENQMPSPSYAMSLYHVPPRMQFLLDYYDKAICPVLVAFDGPSNPYRMYIMQLAANNSGLQNAIAALVTNNMRMRDPNNLPCLTQGVDSWLPNSGEAMTSPIEGPSAEEQHYKTQSIEHLNTQLTNPMKARDDSVLATLLILCLFHICDSGIAKFKTQLAGVQKLLRMRGQVFHSEFVGWVEMFFAWLDVMTSCVNDREIQVHGDTLDLMNLSAHLGALEQYSGCDSRLFKLIARLGRLNLLSQSRPVRDPSDVTPRGSPHASAIDPSGLPSGFGLCGSDTGSPRKIESPPVDLDGADFTSTNPDGRHTFWHEWRDLRRRLEQWDSTYYYGPMLSYEDLASPQRDLIHLSEAFRHSALLYTERLAHPELPSSSKNFRDLVAQGLYHCTEIPINSCVLKFMLWPMFIIGTECVEKIHRDMIRNRCVEIQRESGFYNNLRVMRVLERAWKQNDECEQAGANPSFGGQAFWWRTAMEDVDGEYIVI